MNFFHLFLVLLEFVNSAEVASGSEDCKDRKGEEKQTNENISVKAENNASILTEKEAFASVININKSFELFNSYKLPVAEVSDELIASLKTTNERSFFDSIYMNQFLRHERPGYILLPNEFYEICADFRASKPSIDPNSFSRSEKFAFVDRLVEKGMFFNLSKNGSSKKSNKKSQEALERLKYRAGLASVFATNHYCRDALRIVAGVLDQNQITWLLNNSSSVVLNNSEFLNQLEDFSMFDDSHVIEAIKFGHYDWFKNPKALKTLKPSALLGFFEHLKFDLYEDQLEALNEARPIKELFETSEFFESPFAWQITAGTKYFLDEHINIDGLIEEIFNLPDDVNEEEYFCSDMIKQAVFGLYIHYEHIINAQFSGIITASNLLPLSSVNMPMPIPTDINSNNSVVEGASNSEPLPISPVFPPVMPISHEDIQKNILTSHLDVLENVFMQRNKILVALMKKFKKTSALDEDLKYLLGLIVTPSILIVRKAITMLPDVKEEFSGEPNVGELLNLLKHYNSGTWIVEHHYRKYALILAYIQLKYAPLKIPYRHIPGAKPCSSLSMAHKLCVIGGINLETSDTETTILPTKWPRIFLFQQAVDFKLSEPIQINEHQDEKDIENTANIILNDILVFCDRIGFSDNFLAAIKFQFPENSAKLIASVENFGSIQTRFDKFAVLFWRNLKSVMDTVNILDDANSDVTDYVMLGCFESQLMAVIQNLFEVEMAELLSNDTELLKEFSDFAYMLTRDQVKRLLNSEKGRKLLAENRNLAHNLPTYEDFKESDLKELKVQAQYATMVRTMSASVLLTSLKIDEYVLNDPLGFSMRLFSFDRWESWNNQENGEIINNLWRIVPLQMIVENWKSEASEKHQKLAYTVPCIRNYLKNSKEIQGKVLESIRAILHWVILQEIRFLEGYTLMNSQENGKWRHAVNILIYMNHSEHLDREYLTSEWIRNAEVQKTLRELGGTFMRDFFEILTGPLSQIRAASFLAGRNAMDKNIRLYPFNEAITGFYIWTGKTADAVKETIFGPKAKEIADSPSSSPVKNSADSVATVSPTTQKDLSYTNIPQYREYLENNCSARRRKVSDLLDRLNAVLGVEAGSQDELWKGRLELLGMMSADGFTLSSNYGNPLKQLNLTIHERIIHRKLLTLAAVVDCENLPEDLRPENMACAIIRMRPRANGKEKIEVASNDKSSSTNNNKDVTANSSKKHKQRK